MEIYMKISNMIARFLPVVEEPKPSAGKKILKAVLIAGAVVAFVPTVFKINEDGTGFEGYGLLSTLKYEKKPREGGGYDMNYTYNMIDLDRFGIKKSDAAEEPEVIEAEAVEAVEVEAVEASAEADNTEA